MKSIDSLFKDKIVDHLKDKRRVWVYALNGTSADSDWIDERIKRMKSPSDKIRIHTLAELSRLPRVVDAEVRVKSLEGWRAKKRKGKTDRDGLYGILGANSGYHDIHVTHPSYNDVRETWEVINNPENIPAVFRS